MHRSTPTTKPPVDARDATAVAQVRHCLDVESVLETDDRQPARRFRIPRERGAAPAAARRTGRRRATAGPAGA